MADTVDYIIVNITRVWRISESRRGEHRNSLTSLHLSPHSVVSHLASGPAHLASRVVHDAEVHLARGEVS